MYQPSTSEIVMVRPSNFQFNEQTAVNNVYQSNDNADVNDVQARALTEFDKAVETLRGRGVKVNVLQDTPEPQTPDSIFPNNWFSTHEGGLMVVYPMFAENRQQEIAKFREEVEKIYKDKVGADFQEIDFSGERDQGKMLEGTGSIVIDRKNRVAYCTLSPRADEDLFIKWCSETGHEPVVFTSHQEGKPIYHTNIVMGIGSDYALVGLDAIDEKDRETVKGKLEEGGNTVIPLTEEQLLAGAGNILELQGTEGKFMAISQIAYDSLTDEQLTELKKHIEVVPIDIRTIEYYGGGSIRCTMAEIY